MRSPETLNRTSRIVPFRAFDTSGNAMTTLAYNTAALLLEYRRSDQTAWTTIALRAGVLATWTNVTTTYGFVHDKDGFYELSAPNACFASGLWVVFRWSGAANLKSGFVVIPIERIDRQDSQRMGVNALPSFGTLQNQTRVASTESTIGAATDDEVLNIYNSGNWSTDNLNAWTLRPIALSSGRVVLVKYATYNVDQDLFQLYLSSAVGEELLDGDPIDVLYGLGNGDAMQQTAQQSLSQVSLNTDAVISLLDATSQLQQKIDAMQSDLDSMTGTTGAFLLTFTVTDSTSSLAVPSARVRVVQGITARSRVVDSSGVAAIGVDSGDWRYVVTAHGYADVVGTLTDVSDDAAVPISLTPHYIPPQTDPAKTSAYITTYDDQANPTRSTIYFAMVNQSSPEIGTSFGRGWVAVTSGSDGQLVASLLKSTAYRARRGKGPEVTFTTGSSDTYPLPQVLGQAAPQ